MEWEVDALLQHPDPWHMDPEDLKNRKCYAIRQAFAHHYEHCPIYRSLCDRKKIVPEDIVSFEDLMKIPLITTRAFKEGLSLTSVPREQVVKVLHSSGTTGTRSLVPRDRITMGRFAESLKKAILHVQGESAYVAMMGPSPDELGDLAFSNWARTGCELAEDHEFFLKKLSFDPAYTVMKLNATPLRPVQIGGAPILIMALADYILTSGDRITTLTEESRITSGGGFKTLKGDIVTREQYNEKLMAAFGVTRDRIRDAYAMAELNGMISECPENLKHVPPWIHCSVRDPADPRAEVPLGAEGVPAFLDACAHSYPGFIVADDIVRMVVAEGERCRCGRIGPCLDSHVRRAEGAESRGCGRHIEELRHGSYPRNGEGR